MTTKETLTENMRRLSNIVNEAEQVNELDFNPRQIARDAAGALGSALAKYFKRHFDAADAKKLANSTVRQYENIQDLANSLERLLGKDPSQWAGKLDDYFKELRQITVDKLYDTNWSKSTSDFASDRHRFAHRRMNFVMDKFDKEFNDLIEATATYVQKPYNVEPKAIFVVGDTVTITNTAKRILEKIRIERPAARSLPANHLEAVYKDLADAKDAEVLTNRVKKFLAGAMAFVAFAVWAENSEYNKTGPQED